MNSKIVRYNDNDTYSTFYIHQLLITKFFSLNYNKMKKILHKKKEKLNNEKNASLNFKN